MSPAFHCSWEHLQALFYLFFNDFCLILISDTIKIYVSFPLITLDEVVVVSVAFCFSSIELLSKSRVMSNKIPQNLGVMISISKLMPINGYSLYFSWHYVNRQPHFAVIIIFSHLPYKSNFTLYKIEIDATLFTALFKPLFERYYINQLLI